MIKEHLEHIEKVTNELCKIRLNICKDIKTKPWTMNDLNIVLKQLKNEKSRDAMGYANEIFTLSVAGSDLLLALLKMLNRIKQSQQFSKAFEVCNITSIHKKHARNDFNNYRGIFRISIFRCILDRLMYNDSYETIDSNLTDGNVGARRGRSARDNIYVLCAIINSVINGNSAPIQAQIMDIEKCFDKLWLESCINALYEAGMKNDLLNLLYLENKNAQIAVKVNGRMTERRNVMDVVMQGSVWGSLKCTSVMDRLNKIMLSKEGLQYNYRGDENIPIGVMSMVDDTLQVQECGTKSVSCNSVVNSYVETQRLTFSTDKSLQMNIGKHTNCKQKCPQLKVHNTNMKHSDATKYLGNIVTSKGVVSATVQDRP